MTDPAMLAIATAASAAMAGTYAQSMGEASKQAMGALVTRIKQRFQREPGEEALIGRVVAHPEDEDAVRALADALSRLAQADPRFRDELEELAERAGVETASHASGSVTINAGSIGKSISAGRDLTIGDITM
ncbi:hypothetical protein [Actinomadura hibisca]|uniref:hypothetical protein n=1 Tax=Actinomadura hibisca TaxID=68565 RepID=UPI0008294EDD|nr:hypothetical protein [Actinomadura hibisca]